MILECITGIGDFKVGDTLIANGYSRYSVGAVDIPNRTVNIVGHGNYSICMFTKNSAWKLEREFMEYDPKQQGDTDDDI